VTGRRNERRELKIEIKKYLYTGREFVVVAAEAGSVRGEKRV